MEPALVCSYFSTRLLRSEPARRSRSRSLVAASGQSLPKLSADQAIQPQATAVLREFSPPDWLTGLRTELARSPCAGGKSEMRNSFTSRYKSEARLERFEHASAVWSALIEDV